MVIDTPQSAVADAMIGKATRNVAVSTDVALSVSLDRAPQGAPPAPPGDTSSP